MESNYIVQKAKMVQIGLIILTIVSVLRQITNLLFLNLIRGENSASFAMYALITNLFSIFYIFCSIVAMVLAIAGIQAIQKSLAKPGMSLVSWGFIAMIIWSFLQFLVVILIGLIANEYSTLIFAQILVNAVSTLLGLFTFINLYRFFTPKEGHNRTELTYKNNFVKWGTILICVYYCVSLIVSIVQNFLILQISHGSLEIYQSGVILSIIGIFSIVVWLFYIVGMILVIVALQPSNVRRLFTTDVEPQMPGYMNVSYTTSEPQGGLAIFCPYCGTSIAAELKFCSNCGKKL